MKLTATVMELQEFYLRYWSVLSCDNLLEEISHKTKEHPSTHICTLKKRPNKNNNMKSPHTMWEKRFMV